MFFDTVADGLGEVASLLVVTACSRGDWTPSRACPEPQQTLQHRVEARRLAWMSSR